MKSKYSCIFETDCGWFRLTATEKGLYSLRRVSRNQGGKKGDRLLFLLTDCEKVACPLFSLLRRTAKRLRGWLRGQKADFKNFPIDWTERGGFERRVLQTLRKVPWGGRETYQGLAKQAGRPKAARRVGQILHRNRLPLVIPCHRIVRSDGKVGGFSGGPRLKRLLLKLESAGVDKRTVR